MKEVNDITVREQRKASKCVKEGPSSATTTTTTTIPNNDGLLSENTLGRIFKLYQDWAAGECKHKVPILELDDFKMIYNIIEDLFEHIRCQSNRITDMVETCRLIKETWSTLRKDIGDIRVGG
jgi:flavorubredoxin